MSSLITYPLKLVHRRMQIPSATCSPQKSRNPSSHKQCCYRRPPPCQAENTINAVVWRNQLSNGSCRVLIVPQIPHHTSALFQREITHRLQLLLQYRELEIEPNIAFPQCLSVPKIPVLSKNQQCEIDQSLAIPPLFIKKTCQNKNGTAIRESCQSPPSSLRRNKHTKSRCCATIVTNAETMMLHDTNNWTPASGKYNYK